MRGFLGLVWFISLGSLSASELKLWPADAPGETAKLPPENEAEQKPGQRVVKRIGNVSVPLLKVMKPEKPNGVAVVIAPGGGYNILAWDLEGEEVGKWLNSIGVIAFVLKYRVPRRPDDAKDGAPKVALMDAQRAIRLVRSQAKEHSLDPAKIGMLGFSAGGHLTASTCFNHDQVLYPAVDDADKLSSRPDFAILVYTAYLVDPKNPNQLRPEFKVDAKSPPMLLAHAYDDPVTPESSLLMALAMKRAKVPCELHMYATGGHGFGLRPDGPNTTWPARCAEWMRATKLTK
ncbi:MAG: alpha/beta hydrolase [Fimbriiglobus sp.]